MGQFGDTPHNRTVPAWCLFQCKTCECLWREPDGRHCSYCHAATRPPPAAHAALHPNALVESPHSTSPRFMTSNPIRSSPTNTSKPNFDPSASSNHGGQAAAAGAARTPAGDQPSASGTAMAAHPASPAMLPSLACLKSASLLPAGLDAAPGASNHSDVRRNVRRGGRGRGHGGGDRGGSMAVSNAQRRQGDMMQVPSQHGGSDRNDGGEASDDAPRTQRAGSGSGMMAGRGAARVSANYLLNFQYDNRMGAPGRGQQRGGSSGGRRRPPMPRSQKYDKDKFLQANFRFLVSDAVDVSRFEADPDKMFDWEDVLQVEMLSVTPISCPISLDSPPICPHITPCGHVFSMSSIMQHLLNHGGDKLTRWAPCPLCYQPLVARELRMVQIRQVTVPNVGDTVTFRLLRRPKTSILPQPAPDPTSDDYSDSSPRTHNPTTHTMSPPAASSPWARANAALGSSPPAAAAGSTKRGSMAGAADSAVDISPLLSNPFGKFAMIADASPLWHVAASELAECAVLLTREGGLEAALEAPSIYAALDALAVRARRFAERRQELLEASGQGAAQGSSQSSGSGAVTPAEAGAKAEAAVRAVFMASVDDAKVAVVQKEQRQKVETEFPSLPAGSPPHIGPGVAATRALGNAVPPASALSAAAPAWTPAGAAAPAAAPAGAAAPAAAPAARAGGNAAAAAAALDGDSPRGASAELHFEHAFSEDEDEGLADQAGGNSSGTEAEPADVSPAAPASQAVARGSGAAAASAGASAALAAGSRPFGGREAAEAAAQQSAESLFGTSPNTSKLNTATADGNFYTYQAEDGQWLFLHPLNLRTLLHHYGSYAACPPKVSARLLEVEDIEQNEGVRRRCKALAHLPLRGTYRLAECELVSPELPPESLAPFADEVRERAKRRKRRAEGVAREQRREEAAARAAAAVKAGPSEDELRAMPQLRGGLGSATAAGANAAAGMDGADGPAASMVSDELAEAMAIQASLDEQLQQHAAMASSPPAAGISFAHMTRMGYAATGPVLGREPALGSSPQGPSAAVLGAWASLSGGGGAAASAGPQPASPAPVAAGVWGAAARSAGVPAAAASGSGSGGAAAATQVPAGMAGAAGGSKWLSLGAPKTPSQGQAAAGGAGAGEAPGSSGKKGKKPTLLFSTAQRRY